MLKEFIGFANIGKFGFISVEVKNDGKFTDDDFIFPENMLEADEYYEPQSPLPNRPNKHNEKNKNSNIYKKSNFNSIYGENYRFMNEMPIDFIIISNEELKYESNVCVPIEPLNTIIDSTLSDIYIPPTKTKRIYCEIQINNK